MGLEVHEVSYAFGARVALDAVSLDIAPGVLTGLLGPNGAGKTTLMRLLLGVLAPQRGTVLWDGRPIQPADRRRWGYMPQERALYPGMRCGEQVVHFARLHGLPRAEATERARELLEQLGLADQWLERTDRLSGGMQQRLQLATAIAHRPDVVVLDEPFNGLDPVAVAQLSRTLRELAGTGRTLLFSSHQLDLVQDLCEDIVMIDEGQVVLRGAVSALRASSADRQLRLTLAAADRSWLAAFPSVLVVADEADALRLSIPPQVDPLQVLDAARSAGQVVDFGLDLPTLSQLFLSAAQRDGDAWGSEDRRRRLAGSGVGGG